MQYVWTSTVLTALILLTVLGMASPPLLAQIPADPITCGGIFTFEEEGTFLRDVYVALAGSDNTGDGSPTNPYATVKKAAQFAQPGDIIHVAAGTYTGNVILKHIHGTAAHPIKIIGSPTEETILSGGQKGLHLLDSQYVILEELTVEDVSDTAIHIEKSDSHDALSDYITLRNISVRNIGSGGKHDGIKLSGVHYFYLLTSDIYGGPLAGRNGIDMVDCQNGIIMNNRVESFGHHLVQVNGDSENITIHGNILKGVADLGINIGGPVDPVFSSPLQGESINFETRHIRVTNNTISHVTEGLAYMGCMECLVAHNVIYDPTNRAVRISQETSNQTLLPINQGQFVNNIVVFADSIKKLVSIEDDTAANSFRFAHNLWYCFDNPDFDYTSEKATLPAPEIDPIQQQNPLFWNASHGELYLTAQSPAVNQAEPGWVNTDLDGVCGMNDIGAFDYTHDSQPVVQSGIIDIAMYEPHEQSTPKLTTSSALAASGVTAFTIVPEPRTIGLLGIGMLGLFTIQKIFNRK